MMESPRPQSKVSLEDLLRLKRAERPTAEFWADFEGELRRKQLAAIVDKRPWWRRVSISGLRKLSMPVGAAAVVCLTLVALRDEPAPYVDTVVVVPVTALADVRLPNPSPESAALMTAAVPEQAVALSQGLLSAAASSMDGEKAAVVVEFANATSEASPARTATSSEIAASLAQVVLGFPAQSTVETVSGIIETGSLSTASLVASNLPVLSGEPARSASVPDLQTGTERVSRRSQLLASLDMSYNGEAVSDSRVDRARERITSRLTEQALYDSISRLGLNADRVSIKF